MLLNVFLPREMQSKGNHQYYCHSPQLLKYKSNIHHTTHITFNSHNGCCIGLSSDCQALDTCLFPKLGCTCLPRIITNVLTINAHKKGGAERGSHEGEGLRMYKQRKL